MADIKNLAKRMKALDEQLTVCMRCGLCQSVCPLYGQTGREADVARGKLALLTGLAKEMFQSPEGTADRLNRCLLCGSCAAGCPSGVNAVEIFIRARAILVDYMGLSPVKRLLFRGMLSHPAMFDKLVEISTLFQKWFTRPADPLIGTSCARISVPVIGDRHFTAPAKKPLHMTTPFIDERPGSGEKRIAFFVGCIIDKVFPRIGEAAIRALRSRKAGIFLPKNQACCGIPALSSGDVTTFQKLMRHNLELFNPDSFDHLVTACATCTSTIKKLWPVMSRGTGEAIEKKVTSLAEKTIDISQYLATGVKPAVDQTKKSELVTYHDPCHLKKSLGVFEEPRALLRSVDGIRLVEMDESDRCCGMGGSFNIAHYDLSAEIGMRKRDNIVKTECSVVATGCPACMLQISDMLSKSGNRIKVRHFLEIFDERC